MNYEGDPQVSTNLIRKRNLLKQGAMNDHVSPALLICSGTMRGVYGGGSTVALEKSGMTQVFDTVVGISTGAPVAAYFLAGHVKRDLNVYWEECATPQFLSLKRALKGPVADTDFLCKVFRGEVSKKKLNEANIRNSRTNFYTGVTCAKTGKGIFLDAKKTMPDIVESIRASIALPGLSRGVVSGLTHAPHGCWDGAGALPFPAPSVFAKYHPTDLLVLANCSKSYRAQKSIFEQLLTKFFLRRKVTKPVLEAFLTRDELAVRDIERTRAGFPGCRVGIIWSDEKVGQFEQNSKVLEAAAKRAEAFTSELLCRANRQVC